MTLTPAALCSALPAVLPARAPRKASSSLSVGPWLTAKRGRCVVGSPVHVRPVPPWQRGIGGFLSPGSLPGLAEVHKCHISGQRGREGALGVSEAKRNASGVCTLEFW
uniref:PCNA-associated factor histone-like domain-containing protein n=1 Tax=Amazona collaria TaxID=241587 RepID=A0A8B9FVI2_9PSIT